MMCLAPVTPFSMKVTLLALFLDNDLPEVVAGWHEDEY